MWWLNATMTKGVKNLMVMSMKKVVAVCVMMATLSKMQRLRKYVCTLCARALSMCTCEGTVFLRVGNDDDLQTYPKS